MNFEFKWSVKIVSVCTVVQVGIQSSCGTGRVRKIFRSPDQLRFLCEPVGKPTYELENAHNSNSEM